MRQNKLECHSYKINCVYHLRESSNKACQTCSRRAFPAFKDGDQHGTHEDDCWVGELHLPDIYAKKVSGIQFSDVDLVDLIKNDCVQQSYHSLGLKQHAR